MSLFTVGKDFLGIFYNFQMFLSKHLASLRLTNIEFSLLYMLYNANGTSQDELSKTDLPGQGHSIPRHQVFGGERLCVPGQG